MALQLYMDHHVANAIVVGLRQRAIDVLTAYEDKTSTLNDPALLDRATALKRVFFTQDEDLLAEAKQRQMSGLPFGGVIYAHQLRVPIGICIRDLELILKAGVPGDVQNRVLFLPL